MALKQNRSVCRADLHLINFVQGYLLTIFVSSSLLYILIVLFAAMF